VTAPCGRPDHDGTDGATFEAIHDHGCHHGCGPDERRQVCAAPVVLPPACHVGWQGRVVANGGPAQPNSTRVPSGFTDPPRFPRTKPGRRKTKKTRFVEADRHRCHWTAGGERSCWRKGRLRFGHPAAQRKDTLFVADRLAADRSGS